MTTEGPIETALRATPSATAAEEYAVVLAASGNPQRLARTAAGWSVMVAAGEATQASHALAPYDEENASTLSRLGPGEGRTGSTTPVSYRLGSGHPCNVARRP
jgi:hypothetical protein